MDLAWMGACGSNTNYFTSTSADVCHSVMCAFVYVYTCAPVMRKTSRVSTPACCLVRLLRCQAS